jgi:hypothetical protein
MVDLRTIDLYSYLDLSVFSKVGYLLILTNSMLFTYLKKFRLTFLPVYFLVS